MTCIHLQQLYQLCRENQVLIGGSDLVRFVCKQCGEQEVCPSVLSEEYEARTGGQEDTDDDESAP